MASPAQKADLKRLAEIRALLKQAQALSLKLAPALRRHHDGTILDFSLDTAAERAQKMYRTHHVAVHNALPENE